MSRSVRTAGPDQAQRHRWNRDFHWSDHVASAGGGDASEVAQFDALGFFVRPALLSRQEVERTLAEIDRFEEEADAFLRTQPDQRFGIAEAGAITFTTHLVARSAGLRALSAHPVIVGWCHDLVGPDVRLYWDQAVYKKPDKPRRFPWHQDNGYTFVEPQAYLTVWVALTPATLANGCPQVAPGVHRRGTLAHTYVEPLGFECFEHCDDAAVAEVPAGGAVVFSSLAPHMTGPNLTGDVRKSYILQYAPTGASARRGELAERVRCDEPTRQYEVLRGGRPVPPPGL